MLSPCHHPYVEDNLKHSQQITLFTESDLLKYKNLNKFIFVDLSCLDFLLYNHLCITTSLWPTKQVSAHLSPAVALWLLSDSTSFLPAHSLVFPA